MYQIENTRQVLETGAGRRRRSWGMPVVSRNVVLLGLTSMFTDVSAEMVNTILPLYLFFSIGLMPLQFGVIDGLYQGGAVLVRIVSGFLSDRTRSPKAVAAAGYALSAVTKPVFLVAQGAGAIAALVAVDRIGKGIRTAPRDSLISLSSEERDLGVAFGVHRALDTFGAMIGPLVAFVLLLVVPGAFDVVFVVSFCIAIVGLGVLVLFVRDQPVERPATARSAASPPLGLREVVAVLARPRFRNLVIVGSALGALTISDAFVYLVLQRRFDVPLSLFPLMYVGTAVVYLVLAVPIGRLADRIGRGRVFIAGYAVLALTYATLLLPSLGAGHVLVSLGLLGAYYAMTDGVLAAFASAILPEEARASGLGTLAGAIGLARLLASVLFGLAWTLWDVGGAVTGFLVGLVVCATIAGIVLGRSGERDLPGPEGAGA